MSERDPAVRLRRIAEARERAKQTQAVTSVNSIRVQWTRFWPARVLMARQRVVQVMETFLPGPPSPATPLGAPVVDLIPIQPLGRNVGLAVLASTYVGSLTLTVRADPDTTPDLDAMLAAMQTDWRVLAVAGLPIGRSLGPSVTST